MDLIVKLALGQKITDSEIEYSELSAKAVLEYGRNEKISDETLSNELYEICDRVHSSCNSDCPVYKINGNEVPDTANNFSENRGCDCFKSGKSMLDFLRTKN